MVLYCFTFLLMDSSLHPTHLKTVITATLIYARICYLTTRGISRLWYGRRHDQQQARTWPEWLQTEFLSQRNALVNNIFLSFRNIYRLLLKSRFHTWWKRSGGFNNKKAIFETVFQMFETCFSVRGFWLENRGVSKWWNDVFRVKFVSRRFDSFRAEAAFPDRRFG